MNTKTDYKFVEISLVKNIKKFKIVSLKLRFKSSRAKQKEEERMRTHAQYTGR